ncbi:MAG TPA: hypothetical protein VHU81_18520 [Thermoanaerobaculia bacterium]|jgi:hypothetical protein|nr:hypothetical protein [Thermoanaerobaculia bacterium]
MKKPLCAVTVLAVLASAAAFAADSPRLSRELKPPGVRPGAQPLVLIVDPDGGPSQPSEALHYLVTRESQAHGVTYAFSTPEARDRFVASRIEPGQAAAGDLQSATGALDTCPNARFNNTPGCTSGWLVMACGQTNSYLSDDWNDRISCVEASGSWTILYKCYNFNRYPYNPNGTCSTLAIQGGTTYPDLNVYGFNNITSSIKVCPQGITFSECQNFF